MRAVIRCGLTGYTTPMFFFFSSKRGLFQSLLLSIVVTGVLLLVTGALR